MTPFRWFLTALSFAAMLGVAFWVVAGSWKAGGGSLGLPWQTHAMALGIVGVELVLRAAKIAFSARACGVPLTLGTAARTTLAGDFATAITPARIGAEPARFLVLSEAGVPPAKALLTLYLELLVELASLLIVVTLLFIVVPISTPMKAVLAMVGGYATTVLGVGAIAVLLARRRLGGPPPGWLRSAGMNSWLWRRLQVALRHLRESIAALRHAHPGKMAISLACSVVHVGARLAVLPALVLTQHSGIDLLSLILWPLVLLYGGALVPAPAGGGAMELGFKAAMDGILPVAVLATSLIWWRFYSYFIYVLLGAVAAGRTVMRALRPDRVGLLRATYATEAGADDSRA